MNTGTKRWIFMMLSGIFMVYSFIVYTIGTDKDNGIHFLTEPAKKGKLLFQEYNCISCHQLYGLGGYMGPDLTNIISEPGKGPEYSRVFLQFGSQRMPNFNMEKEEVDALIAYLDYVDKTGISPIKEFEINYDGTINPDPGK